MFFSLPPFPPCTNLSFSFPNPIFVLRHVSVSFSVFFFRFSFGKGGRFFGGIEEKETGPGAGTYKPEVRPVKRKQPSYSFGAR